MKDATQMNIEDEKMVSDAFQHLIDTYLASRHRKKVELITKAFNFAKQAHKGVRRLSGEPYIMHPIAVAQIACGEIGLGSTSICAALLHDVVEDTDYTVDDLSNIFGPKVAQIVDGLTKISGGIFGDRASAQAESFKKLLLTMSDDIRVILIKISDRLHNMRTLGSQLPNKQYKIAGETLYIYAPLANRLGLNKIKEELEDLSFRYEHPEAYATIRQKLELKQEKLTNVFDEFTAPIREKLDSIGVKYTIKARIKTPYSIWCKMQNKHIDFEEVYDILAVRIIFEPNNPADEVAECFRIYACASSIYKHHPERIRDWLSHPKANGYQALHATFMSHHGRWIEVQIRSVRMDEMAEQGFAAHWKYKEGSKTRLDSENELEKWLSTIKEILDDPQPNALDFLDAIKLNLYASEIFVVTPKGEFKTLPADCTALDFAFSIHTFLGTHCIGAKVNHQLVPLSHRLQSGDQVEILTSKTQHVHREWLDFVCTAKAKSKIQAILRREEREMQKKGEDLLEDFLAAAELEATSAHIDKLCALHDYRTREELFAAVGAGRMVPSQTDADALRGKEQTAAKLWEKLIPMLKLRSKEKDSAPEPKDKVSGEPLKIDKKKPLILNEETIHRYVLAPCCHPIPGDDVLGYIDSNHQIVIHKRQCAEANRLKANDGNHILAANWDTHKKLFFPATIQVNGIDRIGVLHKITGILSGELNVNIHRLTVEVRDGIFECEIQLEVHDADSVKHICKQLKQVEGIENVKRID